MAARNQGSLLGGGAAFSATRPREEEVASVPPPPINVRGSRDRLACTLRHCQRPAASCTGRNTKRRKTSTTAMNPLVGARSVSNGLWTLAKHSGRLPRHDRREEPAAKRALFGWQGRGCATTPAAGRATLRPTTGAARRSAAAVRTRRSAHTQYDRVPFAV